MNAKKNKKNEGCLRQGQGHQSFCFSFDKDKELWRALVDNITNIKVFCESFTDAFQL